MTGARQAATLSFVLAVGVIVAGLLGPLGFGVIRFHLTESVENQYIGGEIVTLLLVAPVLVAAGLLWLRQSPVAPVLTLGPAMYVVYTFITVVMGQEYAMMPGNAEKAYFLYIALVAGGFILVLLSVPAVWEGPAPALDDGLRRSLGALFLVMAGFFALAWVGQAVLVYRGNRPAEYVDSPALFWLIKTLDLGFLIPAFVLAGAGLLRSRPGAMRFAPALVGFALCIVSAVLAMATAMVVKSDPSASGGMVLFLLPVWAVLSHLTFRAVRVNTREGSVRAATGTVRGSGHVGA